VGKLARELIIRVLVMRHLLVEESVCSWLECLYCSDGDVECDGSLLLESRQELVNGVIIMRNCNVGQLVG
jgi:hypothetical protein